MILQEVTTVLMIVPKEIAVRKWSCFALRGQKGSF